MFPLMEHVSNAFKGERNRGCCCFRLNRLNRNFPGVVRACAALPEDTVIDGEIVALDEKRQNLVQLAAASPLQGERDSALRLRSAYLSLAQHHGS